MISDSAMKRKWAGALREARGVLERGWTQGSFARDANAYSVSSKNPDATCWCAAGAIQKVVGCPEAYFIWDAISDVLHDETGQTISEFNDSQKTVEPVLEVFDRFIAEWEAA